MAAVDEREDPASMCTALRQTPWPGRWRMGLSFPRCVVVGGWALGSQCIASSPSCDRPHPSQLATSCCLCRYTRHSAEVGAGTRPCVHCLIAIPCYRFCGCFSHLLSSSSAHVMPGYPFACAAAESRAPGFAIPGCGQCRNRAGQ